MFSFLQRRWHCRQTINKAGPLGPILPPALCWLGLGLGQGRGLSAETWDSKETVFGNQELLQTQPS